MKKTFNNFLTKVDYFGERISLRLNKQTSSKTELGGLITILLFLSLSSIWMYQSLSVFYHTNPKVSIETQYLIEREEINLNSVSMPLAFGFTNYGSIPMNLSQYMIFKVSFKESINSANGTVHETYLDLNYCTKENFPLMTDFHFAYYGLNSMFCIKNQNFTVKGYWDELIMKYLSIKTFYCNHNDCRSFEEIKNFLSQQLIYFNIYTFNNALNPQKYETPITQHMLNLYSGIKLNFNKIVEVYIKNEVLESDDNIVFPNFMKENFTSVSYDYKDMDDNFITQDGCLMEYQIISSKNKVIYHRVYTKITEVLASIGGLMHVLMFVLRLICFVFSRMNHNVKILNKIYHYDIEDEDNDDDSYNKGFANRIIKIANENPKYTKAVSRALTKVHGSDGVSSFSKDFINSNSNSNSKIEEENISVNRDMRNCNKINVNNFMDKEGNTNTNTNTRLTISNKNKLPVDSDGNVNANPPDKSRNKFNYNANNHLAECKIPTAAITTNGDVNTNINTNTKIQSSKAIANLKSKISIHPNDDKWDIANKESNIVVENVDDKKDSNKINDDNVYNPNPNNNASPKSNVSKISYDEEVIIDTKEKKKEKRLHSLRRTSKNILMLFNFAKGPIGRKSKVVNTQNIQDEEKGKLERIDSDRDILVNLSNPENNVQDDNLFSPSTEVNNNIAKQNLSPLTLKDDEGNNNLPNNNKIIPCISTAIKRKATLAITEKKSEHEVKDLIQTIISIKSDKHNLNFSLFEIFKLFACRCFIKRNLNSKYLLYNKSSQILDEILDLCNIIHKLEELEKLKMILLSKEQLALFNFISKDWCSLNNTKLINSKINEMKEFNKNQESLAKVFVGFLKELGNKSEHDEEVNEVNEKLLDFLHEDFKNNFIQALEEKN
jgi:hypothetical protein